MFKTFKYSLFCACFLIVLLVQSGFASEDNGFHLVSPELLRHANLKIVWENFIPVRENERLERMLILDDKIYLISNRNFMLSLGRQSGDKIFTETLAPDGLNTDGFNHFNEDLIYYVGNRYIELDSKTGIQTKSNDLDFSIVCPVVRNSSFVYISGIDKRLHTYKEEKRNEIFKVASDNEALITSVIADDDFVVFGTNKGDVYSMLPDSPKKLWEFHAADGIVGQVVQSGNAFYFSTEDMYLYRLDMPSLYSNKFAWKTLMPGIIQKAPRVTDSIVYQGIFSQDMSLTAVDKDSGRILWTLPGGIDLLAESRSKAYCITKNNTLVVMDNITCKQLYSVNFAQVTRFAVNTQDSSIYIGDKTGRVACLKPGR